MAYVGLQEWDVAHIYPIKGHVFVQTLNEHSQYAAWEPKQRLYERESAALTTRPLLLHFQLHDQKFELSGILYRKP